MPVHRGSQGHAPLSVLPRHLSDGQGDTVAHGVSSQLGGAVKIDSGTVLVSEASRFHTNGAGISAILRIIEPFVISAICS